MAARARNASSVASSRVRTRSPRSADACCCWPSDRTASDRQDCHARPAQFGGRLDPALLAGYLLRDQDAEDLAGPQPCRERPQVGVAALLARSTARAGRRRPRRWVCHRVRCELLRRLDGFGRSGESGELIDMRTVVSWGAELRRRAHPARSRSASGPRNPPSRSFRPWSTTAGDGPTRAILGGSPS
jgi:hypothetical protein